MHALLLASALFMGRAPAPAAPAVVAEAAKEPAVGDPAPDFTLPNPMGGTFHLADLAGKKMAVLVFYPKAFTGG